MQKKWIFVFCFLPALAVGQPLSGPRGLKTLQEISSTTLRQVSSRALENTYLRQQTLASRQVAQMDKTLHLPINATQNSRRPLFNSPLEHVKAQTRYHDALLHLQDLRKELDPLLYYQAHGIERRTLHPEEVRQWIIQIQRVRQELDRLQAESVPTDESLQNAYLYLQYALQVIAPAAVVPPPPASSFQAVNRVYDKNEFFLHPPQIKPNQAQRMLQRMGLSPERIASLPVSVRNLSVIKQASAAAVTIPSLPENLKILIFNDVENFTDKLQDLHMSGQFLPNAQLTFVTDIQEVSNQVIRMGNNPDIIITDLTTQKGIEGTLLAQELRQHGYKGVIIACSGYNESLIDGEVLLQSGIDGFFTRPNNNVDTIPTALQNFYYYQELHQWQR